MKAMLSIVCMLLSVVLLGVSGDTCLAYYDSLPSGANCGGAINCAYGLYCDPTSTCSPRLAPGATCTTIGPNECVYTATCKGPTGSLQCVSYASPGEPCSTSNTDTIPNCGSGLFCNPTTNKCVGGQFGDSCTADVDCATNLTCTSNVCTNVANGAFCTGDYQCGPGYACVSSSCTTQAAVGSKADCTKSTSICSFPDTCLYDPVANTTTCVSFNTVAADSYCGSNAYVCANDARCVEGLCAATNLDSQCEQDSDCPYDKACTCGGFGLYTGFGSCTGNPCISKYKDYFTCATTKCYNSLNFPPNYPKACVYTNCNATYNAVMQCASASSLSFSVFLVLLLAFFTSYLSF